MPATGKKHIDEFAGLTIGDRRLCRPHHLPRFNGATDERVHRLGEGRTRFVDGNVKQAHGCGCRVESVALPTSAANGETDNLVATLRGEQP